MAGWEGARGWRGEGIRVDVGSFGLVVEYCKELKVTGAGHMRRAFAKEIAAGQVRLAAIAELELWKVLRGFRLHTGCYRCNFTRYDISASSSPAPASPCSLNSALRRPSFFSRFPASLQDPCRGQHLL